MRYLLPLLVACSTQPAKVPELVVLKDPVLGDVRFIGHPTRERQPFHWDDCTMVVPAKAQPGDVMIQCTGKTELLVRFDCRTLVGEEHGMTLGVRNDPLLVYCK